MGRNLIGRMTSFAFALAVATALVWPAFARPEADGAGSTFAIVGQEVEPSAVLTAKSGGTLIDLKARPTLAVRLSENITPAIAALFGAREESPFNAGRVLTGWPERPGLYCDLLRNRGLGLSTACLYDRDDNGRFDEGRRYDFNSGLGDLLAVTPSGKIIGVRTTAAKPVPVPLPQPVAYASSDIPADATGRLALKWRKVKLDGQPAVQLWITTPDNYTGTEGISAQLAQLRLADLPREGELYGVRLRVLGFDEKQALRYQVISVTDGARVPLMFRGYTFRYIMI